MGAVQTLQMRRHALSGAMVLGAVTYGAAVGFLASDSNRLAVVATLAGAALALVLWRSVALAVIAVPCVWIVQRAPGIDVSYPDVIVAVAAVLAFLAGAHRSLSPNASIVLRSFSFYLGMLLGSVVFNHSVRSDFEWFHRLFIVAGAILVGAWLVREGYQHIALRALLIITGVVSVLAVAESVTHGGAAAYPLWFHKNFVGSLAATTLLVLATAPREFRIRQSWLRLLTLTVLFGLLASQSRGAFLALALGLFIWFFRSNRERRRTAGLFVAVALIGFVAFVGLSVRTQLSDQQVNPHSSISQRVEVETATRELWKQHPFTGVGLRFFARPEFQGYQPPNDVLNETLAEAGFPGLVGFLIFAGGTVMGLLRRRDALAIAALCVVSGRFLHGLVDIYWVAGTTTLPWLIAGMGLARPREEPDRGGEPSTSGHLERTPTA